ncbi:multidrug resistance-associated protein 5 [Tanacetum coccineum]|uniref:Multidrug resistance-associated protein 5 n=1 Tax=Tanacetum coccineum TaxID=301880 RepID=A0ABQ4ZHU8_9ASTR
MSYSKTLYWWIAQRFKDKLRMNPDMKVVDLQEYVMKKNTELRLVDYCYELKRSNPGTTVAMQVDPLADGKNMFNTVGRDANNQIYPIAWAVVQVENTENWEWFLQHLRQDLDLNDGTRVARISNGHKGIIQAVMRVVPNVKHRLCARHIYANFCKKYGGVVFRNLFWASSKATNHDKWMHIMGQLKEVNEEAHQYLIEREPKLWCRSFFKVGVDCDVVENGLSESFNSHIRIARRKPILGLFEDIKCYVMQRNATLRKECEKWEDDICPNIRKVL